MTPTEEALAIQKELFDCFDKDLPIDPKKVKRQYELVNGRLRDLVKTHEQRFAVMQEETRKLTEKIKGIDFDFMPEKKEKIFSELDKFQTAASQWVSSETSIWIESEASSIAAGIMILANEIC